ncbi:MAG: O-antigen ligase family protein [Acidobacteriota bacterium]
MSERLTFGYGTSGGAGDAVPSAPARGAAAHGSGDLGAPRSDSIAGSNGADARPEERERRDWAFIGLMTFTAILFFRPQDTLPVLDGLHLAELSAIAALLAMGIGRLGRGQTLSRYTPELGGVVALGAVILASAPFSIWMGGAIGTFTDLYVKIILIFVLMVNTLKSPKRVDRFVWLIVLATGYLAFRAVFDYARGVNLVENGRVQGAVSGMFGNPNDLALNMVVVIPLAASLAMREAKTIRRLAAALCGVLMIGAVVASQSRGGTIGLAVMLLILFVSVARRKPAFAAIAALLLLLALPTIPSSYWQRVSSITDDSLDATGSRTTRRTLLTESYRAFLQHPLTGVGAGQFKNYDPQGRDQAWHESHNVMLQVAAELGIFGLAIFLFLLARAGTANAQARRLLRKAGALAGRRRKAHPASQNGPISAAESDWVQAHGSAMLASLAGWFCCALFASVAYNWTFYYLLALAAAPREILLDRLAAVGRPRVAPAAATARLEQVRA